MKLNPFKPDKIANPGMFAGRHDELKLLDQGLFQSKNGNSWNFLIHGERGIGKSSLLLYLDYVARGAFPGWHGHAYKFVVVNVALDPSMSFVDLAHKIGRELNASLKQFEPTRTWAVETWNQLKRWEIGGVKINADERPIDCCDALCNTLADIENRLRSSADGIVLLIDEADKGAEACELGEFLKLASERLTKLGCNRVMFGVAGISHVISLLRQSHESVMRILNTIELKPLEEHERKQVIQMGLEDSHQKSDVKVAIRPEAEDWISRYSEGYPHFIQQYAFSAFETDNDNVIDLADVEYAVQRENGALDQLGVRYFEEMYLDKIQSDDYRLVLQAMAIHADVWVKRQDIKVYTGLADSTLGNALTALKTRNIIIPHRSSRGLFRLPTDSFGAWIRAKMMKEQNARPLKKF